MKAFDHYRLGLSAQTVSPTICTEDCEAAIKLATTAPLSKRSKHFTIDWDVLREYVRLGEIKLVGVSTMDQHADIFTKLLEEPKFTRHRAALMSILEL